MGLVWGCPASLRVGCAPNRQAFLIGCGFDIWVSAPRIHVSHTGGSTPGALHFNADDLPSDGTTSINRSCWDDVDKQVLRVPPSFLFHGQQPVENRWRRTGNRRHLAALANSHLRSWALLDEKQQKRNLSLSQRPATRPAERPGTETPPLVWSRADAKI